jgi:hypothetical protein
MVLEFRPTEKEVSRLNRGVMIRSGRLQVILGVGLCCGAIVIALGNTAFGVSLMIAVLAPICVSFAALGERVRKHPIAMQTRRISISDTGIDVELPEMSSHTDWDSFEHLLADRDYYVLKTRGTTARLLFPKRVFQDAPQEAAFLQLVADHNLRPERPSGPGRRSLPLLALVIVGVAVAVSLASLRTTSTSELPTGDPGGRIMATLTSLVDAVPGFASQSVPSFSFPGDIPARLPSTYIERVEPGRIWCGRPKAWIWMPVAVEVDFIWKRSPQQLVRALDERLGRLGWRFFGRSAPQWSDPGGFNPNVWGNSPANPSEVFILSPANGRTMQGWFEAPPATGANSNIRSCTTTSVGG